MIGEMLMKKIKVKIPAKINLTLDVLGVSEGFHNIKSLVASVNLYDAITLYKRNDKKTTLINKGINLDIPTEQNNAYKTAIAFMETFNTNGVDIVIEKGIPLGAGLGSSSADVAGVIKGMKTLFGVKRSVKKLASTLGSDVNYMLKGGYAVMKGKGDDVESIKTKEKFYLVIMTEKQGVSTKECYAKFDELGKKCKTATVGAVRILKSRDKENFIKALKNDLYLPAKTLLPAIENNINILSKYSVSLMSGSGSSTYAIFTKKRLRNKAYKALKREYGDKILKAQTI